MSQRIVREQGTQSVPDYQSRVRRLALIYVAIVLVCVGAIVLIVYQGKLLITLSQRSNVETLTLAFIIVLFAYLTLLSLPGFWGALRIAALNLPRLFGSDAIEVERRKQSALRPHTGEADAVFLNSRLYPEDAPDAPVELPVADEAGSLGTIVIDGVKLTRREATRGGSNSMFAYVEQRANALVRRRAPDAKVEIVQWATIDDEQGYQYYSLVRFSENLQRELQTPPLWPSYALTDDDIATLRRELAELCPTLRNEALLPDVEYSAEHRLPIIPEPLAFISLSRSESRADPVASMGCALIVALVILAIVVVIVLFPPWVPAR